MSILRSLKTSFSKAAWVAYNTYRKGLRYGQELAATEARLSGSRDVITQFQWERLSRLLKHAYQTTVYYRELLHSADIKLTDMQCPFDFSYVPALEKSMIRERSADLLSQVYPKRRLMKNATGGSSGTPLVFYQDRAYWNQRNLSSYYFDRWAGWDFGGRQLIVWGALVDVDRAMPWKQQLNSFWRNHRWLNGFNLTEDLMIRAFKEMQRWRPQTILAYPSSLYLFAKCLEDNRLTPNWELNGIISSAEMLHPHYREVAERVFKAKIRNRYGGREAGIIAMECKAGRMHINCHDLHVEIDSHDPYSQPGEILITQLNNYAMPLIRYRIGDIGSLSDEVCPCGNQLPILGNLLGRTTATFRTRSGELIHGGYFTRQFYGIDTVRQFQLIQDSYDVCRLKLVVNDEFRQDTLEGIIQKIQARLGENTDVRVEFLHEIPRPKSGKIAFTISNVGNENNPPHSVTVLASNN